MNTTTLNMTTLDGGVIIKKGNAPAPPSGGESGGGDWHYFDVSGLDGFQKIQVVSAAMMQKVKGETFEGILGIASAVMPAGFGYMVSAIDEIKAIGTDYSAEMRIGEQSVTIGQNITTAPWYGQIPEITEEQFYTLE